ncbi:hypothetical protein [Actinomadura alba]|uniref:Uncharacterized protein n=1 Tax=Actinomadura alba TaxID=406431 RepID=A0ABR7LVN9_9ACTN|nr:hypothetical protein [Actinomadura alba]MBC6468738.1 hypothetical protein [Actinomadura alba]
MNPYGLSHQVRLPEVFTAPLAGVAYDPISQLNMTGGQPLAQQPGLMRQCSVTYGTPNRDNKTDDGG